MLDHHFSSVITEEISMFNRANAVFDRAPNADVTVNGGHHVAAASFGLVDNSDDLFQRVLRYERAGHRAS